MSVVRSRPTAGELALPRTPADRHFLRSGVRALVRTPAFWVVTVVCLSALVRAAITLRVPSPWILPDEIVYSELAKSIASGHRPSVRGVPVFGWGEVYPTLIAPAWALIEDPVHAYHAALAISALVMSLAAVPAYFLARLFVSPRAAVLVAAMTVLVPSMAYTGVVMTENAFYPVFLLATLLIARAVQHPTAPRQALAIGGLALVAFTRIQGLALVGAYLLAIVIFALTGAPSERRSYVRRFACTALILVSVSLAPVAMSVLRGEGAFGWLGARSGTFADFNPHEVPQWLAYLAGDLILYVALIPAAATAIVIGGGLSRRAAEHVRLFAAVALPVFAATLASVSLVSASLDVDGTENLNERYVFYVVPLLFVGLALWVREGLPRPVPYAVLVIAACCLLAVFLPVDRLDYNAGFQSVALLPWIGLSLPPAPLAVALGGFVIGFGTLWLLCRPDRVGRLWLATGVWMSVVGVWAVGSNAHTTEGFARAFEGRPATWVDRALPEGSDVAVLLDETRAAPGRPDPLSFWLMVTEFFNKRVGIVYRIGPPTYYETFLPTVPVGVRSDGSIFDAQGRTLRVPYLLASCRAPVAGRVLAQAPRGALRLVATEGPLRRSSASSCERDAP